MADLWPGTRSANPVSREPVFIVNQNDPSRPVGLPPPHHEIEIVGTGPGCEAPYAHARIAGRDQAVGQGLRCRDRAGEHFRFPSGAREVRFAHGQRPAALFVQRIEDGFGVDLVGAKSKRLHRPAQRLGFPYGGRLGERSIERRDAVPVEAPAVTVRALAGQGHPRPLRIVRTVDNPAESHRRNPRSGVAPCRNPV